MLVVASGSTAAPVVHERRRVELLDGSLPRQPYHGVAEAGMPRDVIARVEEMAAAHAAGLTQSIADEFAVAAVGIVGGGRTIPSELDRILASHALLHAAEGDLFEQALAEGAARAGLPVHFSPPKTIDISDAIETARNTLGPPWQKDHKLATAAALAALGG